MTLTAVPSPSWPAVLGRWELDLAVVAGLVLTAVAYEMGWRALVASRPGHPPSPGRRAFLGGLAVLVVALLSPVATYSHVLLSAHMVQHLLLTLVAAPLLVAGRPLLVLGATLPADRRRRLLRLAWVRRPGWPLLAHAGHPLAAWLLFAGVGWVVHFSPLFDLSLGNSMVHAAEHVLFLGSAALFWRPVLGVVSRWRLSHPLRLLYLAVAMPQNTFLALAIYASSRPLYDRYVEAERSWGPSPLADQRQGGGIMWVGGDLTLLVAVLAVAGAWAAHEERVTRRREELEDARALSEEAAGRSPSPRTTG